MLTSIPLKLVPVFRVLINSRLDEPMSFEQIACESAYSRRTVRRHIQELEQMGFVRVRRSRGRGKLPNCEVQWAALNGQIK